MTSSPITRRTLWLVSHFRVGIIALIAVALFSFDQPEGRRTPRASAQNVSLITAVSAASFQVNRPVAPNSIIAAFTSGVLPQGTFQVAADAIPGTPAIDLPTFLGNLTVEIHGRSAGIFALVNTPGFDQLNVLVPADLEPGKGPIVIKNASGQILAAGEIEVAPVAPAIFTANSSGSGVPSALIYRYRSGVFVGVEDVFQFNPQTSQFVPRPIDLGPPEDELYLVLFLTGIKQVASPTGTRVLIGGEELIPIFVGPQGVYAGLDQVNLKLSRTLRGRLTLAFTAIGSGTSNLCEIEIAPPSNSPPSVNGLSKTESLAGELVEISGSGFSSDSEVVISDENKKLFTAKVVEARSTSLRVLVPFGAGTGNVVVRNARGEASFPFKMRTSMSGIVQVAQSQQDGSINRIGAPQVTIRVVGLNLPPVQTGSDGSFLLPDVPPTNPLSNGMVFEVDGTTNPALGLTKEKRRIRVITSGRDNPFPEYIELKAVGAQTIPTVAPDTLPTGQFATAAQATPNENEGVGQTGQVTFEPNGSNVQFPDGQPVSVLRLNVLDTGRTPADLPYGTFSSTVAQITPFGARIQPGGRLTFPNTDALPPNKAVTLFRFDQNPNSNTIGQFVPAGTATVSADGTKVVTGSTSVIESTYYFVSDTYQTTTIYGRVVEEDSTPARGALVQVSGQSIFSLTDDNGTFFLLNVPIVNGANLKVEVSFLRPDGTVDRAERGGLQGVAGGLTYVSPPIKLPGQGLTRAPLIVAPKTLSIDAGTTSDFSFLAYARVVGLTLQSVNVSGAAFASVTSLGNDRYNLHLTPGSGAAGNYALILTATDSQNQASTSSIDLQVKAPTVNQPVAIGQSVVTPEDTPVNITLGGTGGTIFRIVNQPLRGRLEGTLPNVLYRPDQDLNGPDTFSFAVGNGTTESAPATVSIAVQPVDDAPVLEVGGPFSTNIGQRLTFVITGRDGDAQQTLTLTPTGVPTGATIKQTTATSWLFDWTPTAAQIGSYTLNLTVADNGSPVLSANGSVVINVDAKWARSPGIDGGLIQCFLVSGSTIFAGTDLGGVFRSTDNGASWSPSGLGQLDIIALQTFGGAIFAATNQGVRRTTDSGVSWTEVNNGLPKVGDNYRSGLSFAVIGNTLFAGTIDGVYKTTNNGADWSISSTGLPSKTGTTTPLSINSFLAVGSTLFAGTSDGVYRSTDSGASWAAAKSGLAPGRVTSLVVNGSTIVAGIFGGGVYRSTNNGTLWTPANNGLTEPYLWSLLYVGNTLFAGTDGAGVFVSSDNGTTWSERGLTGNRVYALAAGSGGTVLAGTYNSIYRTSDAGLNWTRISSGLSNLWVYSVVVSGTSIFTGTDDGAYRSTDNGSSWVRAGLKDSVVQVVTRTGNSVLASTGSLTYRSVDEGASWTEISGFFDYGQVNQVVQVGAVYLASTESGLYRSTDNGANWAPYGSGLPQSTPGVAGPLYGLAVSGNSIFSGTFASGVYRSNDAGATWTKMSTGLPTVDNENYTATVLAANNNVVFAGTDVGLFRSTDNGGMWSASSSGIGNSLVPAISQSGNAFYAGTLKKGVFRSTDNGATWTANGLGSVLEVFGIAGNGSSVFAGTTEGAFVLAEAALAWTESNNGLANRFINASVLDGSTFILGSTGGAYRSVDDGKNWVAASSGLPPAADVRALVKGGAGTFAGVSGSGVYLSTDQGQTWAARPNGLTNNQVNALAADGGTAYVGTEGGVFRSTDGGQNWSLINNGLTRTRVLSLTAGPAGILAGTDAGLFRFSTGTNTWSAAAGGLIDQYIVSLGAAPDGATLLAGTTSGLFRSTNQGQNWTRVDRGISERTIVLSLLAAGNKLLAGTVNGFYISDDNGLSWVVNNTGLLNPQVSALAVKGTLILAGTRNSGVLLSQLPVSLTNHPPALAFSCQTTLTTSVGGSVSCNVSRSDPDGGQTTSLTAGGILAGGQFNSGTGAFTWTPTALHSGTHLVTFTATDNGSPRLASSRDLTIIVNSPVPQLTSLSPNTRPAASGTFLLSLNGSGFVSGARVRVNGTNRNTSFVSGNQILAEILGTDIAAPGNLSITAYNPLPGGGVSNAMTLTVTAPCTYSIAPTNQSFTSAAGNGSVVITTGAGCPWTAVSNTAWLSIPGTSAGTASGTVNYTVAANNTLAQRSGTLTIAGQTFTVNQAAGAGFEIAVDDGTFETSLGVSGGGTLGALNRLTPPTYPATVNGITIAFPAGIAVGKAFTLVYGTLAAGQTNVNTSTLQTLNATVTLAGSFVTYTIPDVTINSGDFLLGFRMVHSTSEFPLNLDISSGSRRRSYYQPNGGDYTLIDSFVGFAGNFPIRARTSVNCAPSIASTSQSFTGAGGTGSVDVTNGGGCTWSAFSNVPWINVTSGATGTGNSNANYSVIVNLTTSARTGTLSIGGRTFTVTQAAGQPELAIDDGQPEQFLGAGGTGTLTVNAVNRFALPVYPLTITGISIYIPSQFQGRAISLLAGTVATSATNLNSVTFQETSTTIQGAGAFHIYTIPNLTVSSGDVVLGFRMQHGSNEAPIANDRTPPLAKRSWYASGGSFVQIGDFDGFDGNFLIRGRVNPPVGFDEELAPMTLGAPQSVRRTSVAPTPKAEGEAEAEGSVEGPVRVPGANERRGRGGERESSRLLPNGRLRGSPK
jgi:uncharacterized protein (TIGR03437 family)